MLLGPQRTRAPDQLCHAGVRPLLSDNALTRRWNKAVRPSGNQGVRGPVELLRTVTRTPSKRERSVAGGGHDSSMGNNLAISLLMALAVLPDMAVTDGTAGSIPRIVVRCYLQTDLRPRDVELIGEGVTHAFEDTIDVVWQVCGSRSERSWTPSCDQPIGRSGLALRLIDDWVTERPEVLGVAAEGHGRAGVLATVLVDRVKAVAGRTGLGFADLAGRVSAHEIVHLLLGKGSHRAEGLMRPEWSDQQLRGRAEWWRIGVEQRRALAEAVRQRAEADRRMRIAD